MLRSQVRQQDPACPRRGHIQASQWHRNSSITNHCGCTTMDRPRCEQQSFGFPKYDRFPTGLIHIRHKQGDSPALRLLCHLPWWWYFLSIQQHYSCREIWYWLQQWNQSTKQSRCPDFFVWKRIHPLLEWTYSNNYSSNEICRVLSCGSWNDCIILNGKVDGATLSHAHQNRVETATFNAPVRQFYCCWYNQMYINSAQIKIVGFMPPLVTFQRGSGTVPYLLE